MTDQPKPELPINSTLQAVGEVQAKLQRIFTMVEALVHQADHQHKSGDLAAARESAADAGDLLYGWLGDSDAVSPLEEALWEGDEDGWEDFMQTRAEKREQE